MSRKTVEIKSLEGAVLVVHPDGSLTNKDYDPDTAYSVEGARELYETLKGIFEN